MGLTGSVVNIYMFALAFSDSSADLRVTHVGLDDHVTSMAESRYAMHHRLRLVTNVVVS